MMSDTPPQAELFGRLGGRVLEIGPGLGASFPFLPDEIDWVGLEPSRDVLRPLEAAAARRFQRSTVIEGVAEDIPLDDDSVDEVLSSLVLCSVEDQEQSLREIRRVLRPGGRFTFVEHVAARRGSPVRLLQHAWGAASRRPGSCDPARDTLDAIRRFFPTVGVDTYSERATFGIRIPHVAGAAYG